MREDTRNTKHGGLSHRRNIHLNIDIERCELDNSNVSEVDSVISCILTHISLLLIIPGPCYPSTAGDAERQKLHS